MTESVDPTRLKVGSNSWADATLIGFRCRECDVSVFGPATFCQSCTSLDIDEVDLGSQGTLYSYTIVRIPPAGWPGEIPYVLGQVELPSGPQVLAEVVDCPHDNLKIGMPMELTLRTAAIEGGGPAKLVYKWRPEDHRWSNE